MSQATGDIDQASSSMDEGREPGVPITRRASVQNRAKSSQSCLQQVRSTELHCPALSRLPCSSLNDSRPCLWTQFAHVRLCLKHCSVPREEANVFPPLSLRRSLIKSVPWTIHHSVVTTVGTKPLYTKPSDHLCAGTRNKLM